MAIGSTLVATARKWGKKVTPGKLYRYLIPLLIFVFILLIIALFFVYRQSNQAKIPGLEQQLLYAENTAEKIEIQEQIDNIKSWSAQLWDFFSTETFKTLAVSVLLATLLTALGKIFKIREALEERIRAQRQTRITAQIDCIKKSEDMWEKLYSMVSSIRFYKDIEDTKNTGKSGTENEKKPKSIEEILTCCEDFASDAEEIVNQWHVVFPILPEIGEESNRIINEDLRKRLEENNKQSTLNPLITIYKVCEYSLKSFLGIGKNQKPEVLSKKEQLKADIEKYNKAIWRNRRPSVMIVFFINILFEAASSVAYLLKKRKDSVDVDEKAGIDTERLQDALGVIQDVIKDRVHRHMLSILKCAVEPQEGYDEKEQYNINKENINKNMDKLFLNYLEMRDIVKDLPPLPGVIEKSEKHQDRNIDYYQQELEKYLNSCRLETLNNKLKTEEINKEKPQKIYDELKELFEKTREYTITHEWEYKYTLFSLELLAKRLARISVDNDLEDREQWLCLSEYFLPKKEIRL
jgi:hypothetical protein